MTLKELQQKTDAELRTILAEARERLRDLRFRVAQDAHKDVREIREVRTAIARVLTLLQQTNRNPKT
ncbi:MAG: 50S ribosomal protein L29 [Patescibacteria group bacterium]